MIDQKQRMELIDRVRRSERFILVLGMIMLFLLAILVLEDYLAVPKTTAYDNAVSPEMHAYLQGPGAGIFLKETDVE